MRIELLAARASKLNYLLRHALSRKAFLSSRVAPSVELAGLLGDVRPATVIDVGANRGQFTLFAVEEWPLRKLLAFEPLERAAEVHAGLFSTDPRIELIRKALGSSSRTETLHVSAADDSSSLLQIGALQVGSFPGTEEVGAQLVEVVTLSEVISASWIEAPALLKIDVQGSELEVLQGCGELLLHFNWILIEVSFNEFYVGQPSADEVVRWTQHQGFEISRIQTTKDQHGCPAQADFLFTRVTHRGQPPPSSCQTTGH